MNLVLLFTAAALLGDSCMSANVNKHMKLLGKEKHIEKNAIHSKSGAKKFVSISQAPSDIYTHEPGTTISLKCISVGSPAPSVHWFKNDAPVFEVSQRHSINKYDQESTELIDSNPTSIAVVRSTLLVTRSSVRDVYTCLAIAGAKTARATTVVYGIGTSTDVSERARLFPLAPHVVVSYKVYLDVIGNNVVIPCRAKGHPRPAITWLNNKEKPVDNDPRMKVLRSGELVISSLSWEDMGGFTCLATNAFGSTNTSTFVYPAKASK